MEPDDQPTSDADAAAPPDVPDGAALRELLAALPVIAFAFDADGVFTLSEGGLLAPFGLAPGQVVGASAFDVYSGNAEIVRDLRRALDGESFATNAVVGPTAFETYYRAVTTPDGEPGGGVGIALDVTQRQQAVAELRAIEEFHRGLLDALPDRMMHLSADGRVLALKPGVGDDDLVPSDWVDRPVTDVMAAPDGARLAAAAAAAIDDGGLQHLELAEGDGDDRRHFEARVVGVDHGRAVAIVRDATDRRRLEGELRRQALTDPLTALGNRTLFHRRVERAIARAERDERDVAVLFCDLDGFKAINDVHGHPVGDELLQIVAERLRSSVRGSDMVARLLDEPEPDDRPDSIARLGGDEFAVLLEDLDDPAVAELVAGRMVSVLRRPVPLDDTEVRVSASIGIALASDADDVDELLRNADLAMYAAKSAGKDQYAVYSPTMHSDVAAHAEVVAGLRDALADGGLELRYQPIVTLRTGGIEGVEALLRWRDGDELRSPLAFIGISEESGLIDDIGEWVLREACAQLRRWDDAGERRLLMSINVSPRQLMHHDFVAVFTGVLHETGVDATRIMLEITETQLLDDLDDAARRLTRLVRHGVRIAVDDFGTGYTSLNWLRRLPLSALKIDRSFVSGRDEGDGPLLASLISMAHALDLDTIAEGIETPEQARHLSALGCRAAQGYHFAHPMEADRVAGYAPPRVVAPAGAD